MAELEIHHEGHESDAAGKMVGVIAAILAVFLSVVTIASHRTHTAAIINKTTANDQWSYYQANRLKVHNVELGENLLTIIGSKSDAVEKIHSDYEAQKEKYDSGSKENKERAEAAEKASETAEMRALRFDFGEGLLEIGLVLTSMYFIARKKMFPVMGVLAGLAGTVCAAAGLFV